MNQAQKPRVECPFRRTCGVRAGTRQALAAGLAMVAVLGAARVTLAQATAVTLSGSNYSQNFDGMTSSASASLPGGWSFFRSGTSSSQPNYFTTGSNTLAVTALYTSGTPTTGAVYLWAPSSDKAIGFLGSSGYPGGSSSAAAGQQVAILFGFTNNTGGTITNLDLGWDYEKYRSGTREMGWNFYSSPDGSTWTANSGGNTSYPADANTTTMSNPPLTTAKSVSLPGLSIAAGTSYYLRWSWVTTGSWSNSQGLGFDNFAMTATYTASASDLYWGGATGWSGSGPGTGGTGTWADGAGSWDSTQTANFNGSAGTVSAGTVTAGRGLKFDTSGYTLTDGTVSLTAASIGLNTITTGTTTPFTTTINSVLAGSAGVTKLGTGTLVLGGANSFTGNVSIAAGTLEIAADAALGDAANDVSSAGATLKTTASIALGSGRDVTGSGTLDIAPGTTLTSSGSFNLTSTTLSNSGTLDLQGATRSVGSLTFGTAAVVNGSGAISASGLTATAVTSGTAVVNPGIAFVSSGDKPVDVGSGGTLVLNGDIAGTTGRIAKTGAGTLIASGSNSTSGFRVGASAATPTNGGTVILTAAATSGTGPLQLNFGTLETTTPLTFANGLSIGGRSNGVAVLGGTNAVSFTGSSSFFAPFGTSGALRLDVNNITSLGRLGPTSGSGSSAGVTFGGSGRLILAGDGTGFADTVTVQSGLTLELANATSLASATLDTTTGTIVYGVASTALGGITGSGNLALPSTSLSVGGNNASTTYSGQFSGAGGLVKTGSGSLTLSAANGHSGGTTLSAGTLVAANAGAFGSGTVAVGGGTLDLGGLAVPNAIAMTGGALTGGAAYAGTIGVGGLAAFAGTVGGTVNVAASGTLAGNGTSFIGPVTFVTGATHAPGSSPGAQTFTGGLVYDPGSALNWELWGNTASAGDAGTLYDSITVTTGSLSIGSTAALNLIFSGTGSTVDWSDPFWTADRSWTVISAAAASASTGVFTLGTVGTDQQGDALTAVLPNASFNVTRSGAGDVVLNFVAVPEPSALALAGLGLLALAGIAARKRWR